MDQARIASLLCLIVAFAPLAGCMQMVERPEVYGYAPLALKRTPVADGRLTARFLGTTTLVLSDGRTTIMTDGFFSRPSFWKLLAFPVRPHEGRIRAGLDAAGVTTASAIFVAHSHHDHAMDTPYVAQLTGAAIVGSDSTRNIALGVSFPDDRIKRIADRTVCRFGDFTVTAFETPHSSPTLFPGRIDRPLGRSARVWNYREGGNFTFHVAHPLGSVLIVPSLGVRSGWVVPKTADVVFLGMGGAIRKTERLKRFWQQFVRGPGTAVVYPIHWDDFFAGPASGSDPHVPKRLRKKLSILNELAGRPDVVKVPPYASEIVLADGRRDVASGAGEAGERGCVPVVPVAP